MPGILLGTLFVMISNLQMMKPSLREVKFFAQGHTGCKIYSKHCICPTLVCCFITNCWTFLSGCWVQYLYICLSISYCFLPSPENSLTYWRTFAMKHLKVLSFGLGFLFVPQKAPENLSQSITTWKFI